MIKSFFNTHNLTEKPLLLALSGGPDSIALFYQLLDINHPFQVAHVDHGWRAESSREAALLKEMCQEKKIAFHLRKLKLEGPNLEDLSRQARLLFFHEVCLKEKLIGVLLAHHADDQAETVLKRVLEGASLPKLKGLSPVSKNGDLLLYRPLLNRHKKEILNWLEERGISYFSDPTNKDPRFLRSRMRETLLPDLSSQFGKQVSPSLCRLAESAQELSLYLEEIIAPFRKEVICQEGTLSLDFSKTPLHSPFICKAIIRDLFEKARLALPRSVLETILLHLQQNSVRKTIQVGKAKVNMHRQILTLNHHLVKNITLSVDAER